MRKSHYSGCYSTETGLDGVQPHALTHSFSAGPVQGSLSLPSSNCDGAMTSLRHRKGVFQSVVIHRRGELALSSTNAKQRKQKCLYSFLTWEQPKCTTPTLYILHPSHGCTHWVSTDRTHWVNAQSETKSTLNSWQYENIWVSSKTDKQ